MEEQKAKNKQVNKLIARLFWVLLIVIGLFYFAWQNYQMTTQITQLQHKIQEQNLSIELMKSDAGQYLKSKDLVSSPALLEVQYLVRLANISLVINHDASMAIQLLTIADQRFSVLNDPSLAEIRQVLAKDIGALKVMPEIDTIGIVSKLNILSDRILKLPIPNLPVKPSKQEDFKALLPSELPKTFWQKFITSSMRQLQNIIIIKRHEQSIPSVLSEEQQIDLMQKMQLTLNQAQWAVLHQQDSVYQAALLQVINLSELYFINNPTAATDINQAIKELQKIILIAKTPELNSLQVINKTINQLPSRKAE